MIISLSAFSILVLAALGIVGLTPIVMLLLLVRDWKENELW